MRNLLISPVVLLWSLPINLILVLLINLGRVSERIFDYLIYHNITPRWDRD